MEKRAIRIGLDVIETHAPQLKADYMGWAAYWGFTGVYPLSDTKFDTNVADQ